MLPKNFWKMNSTSPNTQNTFPSQSWVNLTNSKNYSELYPQKKNLSLNIPRKKRLANCDCAWYGPFFSLPFRWKFPLIHTWWIVHHPSIPVENEKKFTKKKGENFMLERLFLSPFLWLTANSTQEQCKRSE